MLAAFRYFLPRALALVDYDDDGNSELAIFSNGNDSAAEVYELDGSFVAELTDIEEEELRPDFGRSAPITAECGERFAAGVVRLDLDSGPYEFRVSNSVLFTPTFSIIGSSGFHQAVRTIVRIWDAEGDLAYHEVIESLAGPGSAAVIDLDAIGRQGLLVADDDTVLLLSK